MKYEPEVEALVFFVVQELGEASLKEIWEYMKDHESKEISSETLLRYVRRWKAKKIFALNYVNNEPVYKLADIPPWYVSGVMALVKGSTNVDMRTAMEALDERLKEQGRIIKPKSVYRDYTSFEVIFETVDPILGGRPSATERELEFPRKNGKPVIPPNWLYGYVRDNAALADLPAAITYHIAWSHGEFLEVPKLTKEILKVKTGLATYEVVSEGTKFKATMRIPFRGTDLRSIEQFKEWFDKLAIAPLRGLGANPRAYGGRVRIVSLKTID